MSLNHCQLCGNEWANHGAACPPLKVVYDPSHEADATAAYMVGVEAGKDAMRAEVAKLREELAEARKVIEELADVLHSVDENTAADFLDSVESKARAFLARKEEK